MSAALYNNACAPAQANPAPADSSANSTIPESNRLHLLPEQNQIVYTRCLDHLAKCQLPQRCARVFYIIINQTLGFGKCEDNMTTTRLEQLTQIRHDHAGKAMRDLAAMNIIIHRQGGKFRNWLSVNFNLEMWGNSSLPEHYKSNDPAILLPKKDREKPIDRGIKLDPQNMLDHSSISIDYQPLEDQQQPAFEITKTTDDSVKIIPNNAEDCRLENNNTTETAEENVEITPNNTKNCSLENNSTTTAVYDSKQLEETLSRLFNSQLNAGFEKINQRLSYVEQGLAQSQTKPEATQNNPATAQIQHQTPEQELAPPQSHDESDQEKQSYKKPAVSKPQTEIDKPSIQESHASSSIKTNPSVQNALQKAVNIATSQSEKFHPHPCKIGSKKEVVEASQLINFAEFTYPESLNKEQCHALHNLLIKGKDRAQDLLNLLAQRLQNTHNPVSDPVSYFASLVALYQKNAVDFSGLKALKPKKSRKEIAYAKRLHALKLQYNECYSDYQHFQQVVQREMQKDNLSFEAVCQNSSIGVILHDCETKLAKAKTELDECIARN